MHGSSRCKLASSRSSARSGCTTRSSGPAPRATCPSTTTPRRTIRATPAGARTCSRPRSYPNGLTLKDIYIANPVPVLVFQEVLSDFGKCGVTVSGIPVHAGFYGTAGIGVVSADGLKFGKWDIAVAGWLPDWFGPANGRAILPDLFDGALSFPGTDFGGYDDPAVDTLVTNAEAALKLSQAASDWHQADEKVMADAAFIPVETNLTPLFRSVRVHNAIYFPLSLGYDLSQIWLST
jgi:ABC-type transport system substrate-binding protein